MVASDLNITYKTKSSFFIKAETILKNPPTVLQEAILVKKKRIIFKKRILNGKVTLVATFNILSRQIGFTCTLLYF